MQHEDHVALIRGGVMGAGPRWLELGAGTGEFTLALADVLGAGGDILALDRDRRALADLQPRVATRYPAVRVTAIAADFTHGLPDGPFDGVLAANSLHFVADPLPVLREIRAALAPAGRLILVEYDAERGNPWVPHPISLGRLRALAPAAGLGPPQLLHRVASRFLGSIYAAVVRPAAESGVLHSGPHGDDREE